MTAPIPWSDLSFDEQVGFEANMAMLGSTVPPEEEWAKNDTRWRVAWRAQFAEAANEAWDALHDAHTAELLDELAAVLRRFVVFPHAEESDFIALWVLHTYVYDLFDTTPYLNVTSAAKQSGKSRLLVELLLLVARPWSVFDASEAVLLRKVDKEHPTLLVDEVDATFGKDSKVTEGLRAIYNVGYRRGAKVARCVGNSFEPKDFDVYGPKAFAGLSGLPDTVRDRCGHIELRRRSHNEPKPERLRAKPLRLELEPLAARLREWADKARGQLEGAEPVLPDTLSDRAQDGCECLAAIADLAGFDWPERSRKSFKKVMGEVEDADPAVLLLEHCREAFEESKADRLPTVKLLAALVERGDDSPWAGWWGSDVDDGKTKKPAMRLAKMLSPYGVKPKPLRLGDGVTRGYERSDFTDAWSRYLPADDPADSGVTPSHPLEVVTSLLARSEALSGKNGSEPEIAPEQDRNGRNDLEPK